MSIISPIHERELARWYKLIPHPEQLRLIEENKRFPVIPAGRRSGKTERFKRKIVKSAMNNPGFPYFAGAPTRDQAKRIFWKDLKQMSFESTQIKKPYETDLIIELNNEATISLIGFDKPARFEGSWWAGGGIDEVGDLKENAIKEHILPALDTFNPTMPDYKAWCWFFGVPEGLNHYYDIAQYAKNGIDNEWGFYTWKSADILPPEVIEAKKRLLSLRQFRQEYEASFETVSGRIYEDYNELNHTKKRIKPHEELCWMHDQNFTPLSSAISVLRKDKIYILDEIVLESAITKQLAIEFCDKFRDHHKESLFCFGGPSGRNGEIHGHDSDYTEMEKILTRNGWTHERRIENSHPPIRDRQNSLRAKICNAFGERSLFVNPNEAEYVDKGLSTVQVKKGSSFIEDQKNKYQHITTAVGYYSHYEFPIHQDITDIPITFNY